MPDRVPWFESPEDELLAGVIFGFVTCSGSWISLFLGPWWLWAVLVVLTMAATFVIVHGILRIRRQVAISQTRGDE